MNLKKEQLSLHKLGVYFFWGTPAHKDFERMVMRFTTQIFLLLIILTPTISFSHGEYDAESIERLKKRFDAGRSVIYAKYYEYLTSQAGITGEIEIKLRIYSFGRVSKLSIEKSTLDHKELEESIMTEISTWEFGEVNIDDWVHYTLKFIPD